MRRGLVFGVGVPRVSQHLPNGAVANIPQEAGSHTGAVRSTSQARGHGTIILELETGAAASTGRTDATPSPFVGKKEGVGNLGSRADVRPLRLSSRTTSQRSVTDA
jgi:hypothetical protein